MIKQQLLDFCYAHIDGRMNALRAEIEQLRQSAATETKSSAGDKYETGRAMIQIEIETLNRQLSEAMKARQALESVQLETGSSVVQTGSCVQTSEGEYFIAISAGQAEIAGRKIFTVSPATPLAKAMLGLRVGQTFVLNKKQQTIKAIW